VPVASTAGSRCTSASASCRCDRCSRPRSLRRGGSRSEPDRATTGACRCRGFAYPGFNEQFTIDGSAPRKGEIWKNPNLAHTLEAIAQGRPRRVLQGPHRADHRRLHEGAGGFLSYDDLAAHQGEWVEPVSTNYRGYDVWELPPNSAGHRALQILNILEGYDLKATASAARARAPVRRGEEARVRRSRAFYADPGVREGAAAMAVSKDYAAERRKLIDLDKREERSRPAPRLKQGDTIYLTTADRRATWSR
jgi:gamma-glutamyltranspeptidase/glutathione hydrolase